LNAPSNAADPEPAWVGDVLQFWFEELPERDWFVRSAEIDARIRARFLALHERLMRHEPRDIAAPRAMLAAVIVLDQFSRNLFRGDPRAFAADPVARRIAKALVEQGLDREMTPQERLFAYLPFEHSENREDQALSVTLFSCLGNDDWTRYAIAHQQIIDRCGRFPHRNAVLGRPSTADEIALLQDPANSF
jgi:uncharacterized protein (DUF924 family)